MSVKTDELTRAERIVGALRKVTVHLLVDDGSEVAYQGYAPQRITVAGTDDALVLPDIWIEFPMCTGGHCVASRFCLKRPDGSVLLDGDVTPVMPIENIVIPQLWLGET